MQQAVSLVWFRRDLRIVGHPALHAAIGSGLPVAAVYVWENRLPHDAANRFQTAFVRECLEDLRQKLAAFDIPLTILHGKPEDCLPPLARSIGAQHIFCHRLYDAASVRSERLLGSRLIGQNSLLHYFSDGPFPPETARMQNGNRPFTRFADYKTAWLEHTRRLPTNNQTIDFNILKQQQTALPPLFRQTAAANTIPPTKPSAQGGETAAETLLADFAARLPDYASAHAFPAKHNLPPLSAHISQGTLPSRRLLDVAQQYGDKNGLLWLDGLIRREFAQQYVFRPHSATADDMPSENRLTAEQAGLLQRWQNGRTGYPLIDAAMRHLFRSGLMHPALRRLTAEFLLHHLRLPQHCGEAWFARNLADYDPAINHANWLLAGETEAAAFAVRSHKLDPDGRFIRRHLPELAHLDNLAVHYPAASGADIDTHGYPPPIPQQALAEPDKQGRHFSNEET